MPKDKREESETPKERQKANRGTKKPWKDLTPKEIAQIGQLLVIYSTAFKNAAADLTAGDIESVYSPTAPVRDAFAGLKKVLRKLEGEVDTHFDLTLAEEILKQIISP